MIGVHVHRNEGYTAHLDRQQLERRADVLVQRLEHGSVAACARPSHFGADKHGHPLATIEGGDVGGGDGKYVVSRELEGRGRTTTALDAEVGLL